MTMQEGDHDSRATGHRRARDAGSGELQRRTTQTRGRRRQPTSGSVSASSHGVCATFRVWPPTFGKCLTQLQPRGAGPATQHPTGGESGPTVWLSSSRALDNSKHTCHVISGPKEARRQLGPGIAASQMGEVLLHVACAPCRAASWHPASGKRIKRIPSLWVVQLKLVSISLQFSVSSEHG